MDIENINIGDAVIYVPKHLLLEDTGGRIRDQNLGIVTSKNDHYVFVRYLGLAQSQATLASDIYSINNRPDLIEKLGLEVNPINKVCELYLKERDANKI